MDDGDPDDAVSSKTLLMRRLREVELPKWMLLTESNRKAAINRIQPILVEAPLSSKARTITRTAMPSELRSLLLLAETEIGKKLLAEDPGYLSLMVERLRCREWIDYSKPGEEEKHEKDMVVAGDLILDFFDASPRMSMSSMSFSRLLLVMAGREEERGTTRDDVVLMVSVWSEHLRELTTQPGLCRGSAALSILHEVFAERRRNPYVPLEWIIASAGLG